MTRELVWTGFMTLDGKVDSPGSTSEGHAGGGWVFDTEFVPESYSLKEEELRETSALMFGRRSYQAFAPVWSASVLPRGAIGERRFPRRPSGWQLRWRTERRTSALRQPPRLQGLPFASSPRS